MKNRLYWHTDGKVVKQNKLIPSLSRRWLGVKESEIVREIKFRVWDKYRKRMSDVADYCFLSKTVKPFEVDWSYLVSGSYELMQYTGLKDKKSKEIYEGDIIRGVSSEGDLCNFVVKYSEFNHRFIGDCSDEIYYISPGVFYLYEVIGNIYENPELLGGDPHD